MEEVASPNPKWRVAVRAICCVIAADGRVTSSEIDAAYDVLVGSGQSASPDRFRDAVIDACKAIHAANAVSVARELVPLLCELKGTSLGTALVDACDELVCYSTNDSERTVVDLFRGALCEDHVLAKDEESARQEIDGWSPVLTYTATERFLLWLRKMRLSVDAVIGSRFLVVQILGFIAGVSGLFASGSAIGALAWFAIGSAVGSLLLLAGADSTLYDCTEGRARDRAALELAHREAASLASSLTPPPAGAVGSFSDDPDDVAVGDPSPEQDAMALCTAMRLVDHQPRGSLHRARVARSLLNLLRGSTRRGGGRSACRCSGCGRRYWFDLHVYSGGVICPYCGLFQLATLDWKPEVPAAAYVPAQPWINWSGAGSYSTGPVYVRGYVNKRGRWVNGHTRSRPRRRRW
jgi:hypothetical protein